MIFDGTKKKEKFNLLLIVISVLGFLIRLLVCKDIFENDFLSYAPPSFTDMYTYLQLSESIISGNFHHPFFYQPFYYVVFLPLVHFLTGDGIWHILLVHSLLGAATIWLTGMTTAYAGGRRAGIIAAILMAVPFMPIFYTAYILIATLKTFLVVLLLFIVSLAIKKRDTALWCSAAFLSSVLTLTRANTIVFLPFILIFAFFTQKRKESTSRARHWVARLFPIVIICLIFILPQLPFIIHNSLIEGRVTPPSTAGAANLAIGNNPEACPARLSRNQTSKYWIEHEKEISIPKRIISWAADSPLSIVELTFRKLLLFWDSGTAFDNMIYFNKSRHYSKILSLFPLLPTSLYLAGFLAYAILFRRKIIRKKLLLFPILITAAYWGSTALFIHLTRYRLPLFPIFALFSALFLNHALTVAIKKSYKRVLLPAILFGSSLIFVLFAYPIYRFFLEKHVIAIIQPEGVCVKLGRERVYIDNGPKNMGSWKSFPLLPYNIITKRFKIHKEDIGKDAEFHILLTCTNKKPIQFRINKKLFTHGPVNDALMLKFRIKVPKDGEIVFEPITIVPGTVFAYCDLQRDFGRTSLNSTKINGELVCRLIVIDE